MIIQFGLLITDLEKGEGKMKEIEFLKMSGAGNDFIVIDNREGIITPDNIGGIKGEILPLSEFIRRVCTRRWSIGADGLMLLEKSDKADFRMRYFNSDGGEAEMCGNGARCIARFAYLKGAASKKMSFETIAGFVSAEILEGGVKIGVDAVDNVELELKLALEDGTSIVGHYIRAGVPHTVLYEDDVSGARVVELGRRIRYHKHFPRGTNVNFVQILSEGEVKIRTYERGVEDETLACGTGAVASAVLSTLLGKAKPPILLHAVGGDLTVDFKWQDGDGGDLSSISEVSLTGDARVVMRGRIGEETWQW
jgi:diaminopimelate epimerase